MSPLFRTAASDLAPAPKAGLGVPAMAAEVGIAADATTGSPAASA